MSFSIQSLGPLCLWQYFENVFGCIKKTLHSLWNQMFIILTPSYWRSKVVNFTIALVVINPSILKLKINIWPQAISARDHMKDIKNASLVHRQMKNDNDDFAWRIARQDDLCTDLWLWLFALIIINIISIYSLLTNCQTSETLWDLAALEWVGRWGSVGN